MKKAKQKKHFIVGLRWAYIVFQNRKSGPVFENKILQFQTDDGKWQDVNPIPVRVERHLPPLRRFVVGREYFVNGILCRCQSVNSDETAQMVDACRPKLLLFSSLPITHDSLYLAK